MRRLRDETDGRRVWIDAVCINQDDIDERNRQVSIMGSIYKSARRVYIYVGEEDLHGRLAMSYLQAIEKREIQFDTPTTQQELVALEDFLARPWFTRIWVLQEVYQAKEPILICGDLRVSWAAIQTLRAFESLREARLSQLPYVTTVKDRKFISSNLLHKLLAEARTCHATDPRDKLYALLPLLLDAKNYGLAADYSVSRARCFYDVVIYLARTLDLRFLSDVSSEQRFIHMGNMPTWVPDWASRLYRTPLNTMTNSLNWKAGTIDDHTREQWRLACQQVEWWANDLRIDDDIKDLPSIPHLVVPGILVDEIDTILPPANLREKSWKEILCEWDKEAQNMELKLIRFNARSAPLEDINPEKDVTYLVSSAPRRPILQALLVELAHPRLSNTYNLVDSLREFEYSDRSLFSFDINRADPSSGDRPNWNENNKWVYNVKKVIHGRRFFRTKCGYFGVASEEAEVGDIVTILANGPVPYVLRKTTCLHGSDKPASVWSFIGDCYLAGAMTGWFTRAVLERKIPDTPDVIEDFHIC